MSYVAEPYAQFVDDLLTGFTGGRVRESFRFLPEQAPFRLGSDNGALPNTLRVYGQVEALNGEREFQRFTLNTDFKLKEGRELEWLAGPEGLPADGASWPATGSQFYVNYEALREFSAAPLLTDRSPGSVTRLLAESVGREYAVLSGQLEHVYQAGFLDTAKGRDLDNLVKLLGLERRGRNVAQGTVTFSRRTPAPADITVAAGTRLTTGDAPVVSFETTETVTLQRGQLSVDASINALVTDATGVVKAGTIVAINRPVLGLEAVSNAEPTKFAGSDEGDAELRARAKRALEGSGKATVGALIGALTGMEGVREKDMRFSEDPIEHPGIVNLDLALPKLEADEVDQYKRRALELLEETRPVGIRIKHNIEAPRPPGPAEAGAGQATGEGDNAPVTAVDGTGSELHFAVDANITLQPSSLSLTAAEREQLVSNGQQVVRDFIAEAGLGETLVYNRLITQLMNLDGVLDVSLEWFPASEADQEISRTVNILPRQGGARPVEGAIDVQIGNALIAVDAKIRVTFTGAGTLGSQEANAAATASSVRSDLQKAANVFAADTELTAELLRTSAGNSESYSIDSLGYQVEYIDAGIRIDVENPPVSIGGIERLWVRSVDVIDEAGNVLGSSA